MNGEGEEYLRLIDPATPETALIAADWLEDRGRTTESAAIRRGDLAAIIALGYGSGDGYGSGYGSGDGDGSGSGYGSGDGDGYGSGDGYGDGYGDGDGYGSGDGYGDGYVDGSGYGYGSGKTWRANVAALAKEVTLEELIVGRAYLWMLGGGWMVAARFRRRDGLFGAVLTDVVNVCRTGGTAWPDLARGRGRDGATFVRWPAVTASGNPFPYAVPICTWEGDLP